MPRLAVLHGLCAKIVISVNEYQNYIDRRSLKRVIIITWPYIRVIACGYNIAHWYILVGCKIGHCLMRYLKILRYRCFYQKRKIIIIFIVRLNLLLDIAYYFCNFFLIIYLQVLSRVKEIFFSACINNSTLSLQFALHDFVVYNYNNMFLFNERSLVLLPYEIWEIIEFVFTTRLCRYNKESVFSVRQYISSFVDSVIET